MSDPENVLIYRLGSLGDTVVALPAFHLVRARFPKARITLLTNRPVASKAAPVEAILGSGFFFDDVLDYPVGTRDPHLLLSLIRELRKRRIATVVTLAASRGRRAALRDQLFFKLAGAKTIVGSPREKCDFEVCRDPATGLYEWETGRLLRRLGALGKIDSQSDEAWDLRLTGAEIGEARSLTAAFDGARFIAMSIGTKVPANDWEESNWRELLSRLDRKYCGWGLLLFGASEERTKSEGYSTGWTGPVINLCGAVSPRVSAAAVKNARIFIGHDSGPMHLAAAVGVPCVGIFAARHPPGWWYPRGGGKNRIIYHQTDCYGCGLDECIVEKKKCILGISADEVERAVGEILAAA
ncbi:MAG: glycosyltransferase family 9 protein [Chthoniobacterales bacterium]